jgi:hypothetical protein
LDKYNQGSVLVELGYNFQLQNKEDEAVIYDNIERIKEKPNEVYGIAASFEKKVLLENALKSIRLQQMYSLILI